MVYNLDYRKNQISGRNKLIYIIKTNINQYINPAFMWTGSRSISVHNLFIQTIFLFVSVNGNIIITQMLIFMRHGQRGDNQYPPIHSQIMYDPPLAPQARNSLKNSADQIFQTFKQNNINKFSVVSSPFLRCLMTSQLFCQQMKQKGVQQKEVRKINFQISEFLRPDWFSQYPLEKLVLDLQNRNVLSKYLLSPEKWHKTQFDHNLIFPQNYGDFDRRITNFKKALVYPKLGQAIVYVTHGFVVRQVCWKMNHVTNYRDQIKFCGYAVYQNLTGNKDILLKSKL